MSNLRQLVAPTLGTVVSAAAAYIAGSQNQVIIEASPSMRRLPVIVMGVSGSGKSSVGAALAARLAVPFIDGDALHPAANIASLRRGMPLTDEDRWPWLDRIAHHLCDQPSFPGGIVIACSALKRAYRDRLRIAPEIRFIFLDADRRLIHDRLAHRVNHFMPPALAASQFSTLERPTAEERDVCVVAASLPIVPAVEASLNCLR